jgi:carbamoyl-phosphate synthase large subunit
MFNIAITGIGGGVGQSIIKSLDNTDYNVVGLDGEPLAAGLYAVPKSYIVPYSNKPHFIPTLLDICQKEKIHLLFPGLDAELMPLSQNIEAFKKVGTTVVVSSKEVITISDDKQQTYNQLTKVGVKVPFTCGLEDYAFLEKDLPLIVKQKVGGARSKNVFVVKTIEDWVIATQHVGDDLFDFIVQEYIEGDEYTCGTINWDGQCHGVIVMRRILRDGDTHKCFSVKNTVIEDTVRQVAQAIKPFGACNIQLRMKDGVPYIFEINARCSGTTAARTLCGFNEPKMIADHLLKGIKPVFDIKEQTILRYWKELVVENEVVSHLKDNKHIASPNHSVL